MEIILLESISKLGGFGDRVKVKAGFARNYLVPTNKAIAATPTNIQYFEEKKQEFQEQLKLKQDKAQNRADLLKGCTMRIEMNAHDDGKLYGSVGIREIISLLTEQGVEVEKSEVQLPDGPFREAGDYTVNIDVSAELTVGVPLQVIASQQNQSTEK